MSFVESPKLATMELIFKCLTKAPHGKIPRINAEEEKKNPQKKEVSFKKIKI